MDNLKNHCVDINQQLGWKNTAQQFLKSGVPAWLITLLAAIVFTAFYNRPFFSGLSAHLKGQQPHVLILFAALLFLLNHLIITLFSTRYTLKLWLIALFFSASVCVYFMTSYGVMIDKTMLQNALETDVNEVRGLIDIQLFVQLFIYFVLPIWLLSKLKIKWTASTTKGGLIWLGLFLINLIFIAVLLVSNYQTFSSVFRNYREVKHLAVPFNGMAAGVSLVQKHIRDKPRDFKQIAMDAQHQTDHSKPDLLVVVVGETARADHFSINGYTKQTTPRLQALLSENKQGRLFNFSHVSSCGTATAVSVPCMFSAMNKRDYDDMQAKYSENVLDVAQRVGINTVWIDNNSGCKGVCERIPFESIKNCPQGNCSDLLLVSQLEEDIQSFGQNQDQLIVLHQLGSHGPEYFKRSLQQQKKFLPECTTNQFQVCDQQTIINAYDNSIVATDEMLAKTILVLSALQQRYNTALIYISDHGESLGEEGVYLHGLPYALAPESQKHVPMLFWLSNSFIESHQINQQCLGQQSQVKLSQDDLFPTLLRLLNINTQIIKEQSSDIGKCLV